MISDLNTIISLNELQISDYLEYFIRSIIPKYISIIDLYVLNQLHHIPIIIYDVYDQPFIIFDNGIKFIKLQSINIGNDSILNNYIKDRINFINIKLAIINPTINSSIYTVYSLYFIK